MAIPESLLKPTLFFFKYLFYLFIYGCVGSSFLCEGFLQLRQVGATLHRGARASHHRGLSCCRAQAPDAQAQQLWLTGPVAPRHVGSSQTRARTQVPCIGRQILNHCATREARPFLSQVVCLTELQSFLHIDFFFFCKYFPLICGLSFYLAVQRRAKVFNFSSLLSFFFLSIPAFCVIFKKYLPRSPRFFLVFSQRCLITLLVHTMLSVFQGFFSW